MNKSLLATALLSSLALTACFGTTIEPGRMGIKYISLDDNGLKKKVLPEGFYFQWPWNDIITYDVTWQTRKEKVEVLTADDLHVPTTVAVTFRPHADQLYQLHTEIGRSYYEDVIQPAFITLVRSEFAKYEHNDLARKSPEIERAIMAKLKKSLRGKPLDLDEVAIAHIRFDTSVTDSISTKLVKEQQAEQKRFELDIAKQDAEIERERARGAGDAVRIRAEGEAKAIVIKGKAESEAQEAIARTLTKAFLQYKAFDSKASKYYFLPTGKDGLPLIIDAGGGRR